MNNIDHIGEKDDYTFYDFCVERGYLPANHSLTDARIMWDVYANDYREECAERGADAEDLDAI